MPRPGERDTRVVFIKLRDGTLQLPYRNAVPTLGEWMAAVRHVAGEHYCWAFVTDVRRPGVRRDRLASGDGTR